MLYMLRLTLQTNCRHYLLLCALLKSALLFSNLQLSELIRGAADGAQNNTQHKVLLQQLHQLCSYTGLHRLQDPAQQMAAVLQYVQEVRNVTLLWFSYVCPR